MQMTERIVLTGAGGFVAGSVMHQRPGDVELHGVSRGGPRCAGRGMVWHTLDILDTSGFHKALDKIQPRAIIHAAACADIDYSEAHPEETRRLNVEVPAALAAYCTSRDIRLVHLSTDNVFDGEKGLYGEEDPPRPVNYYGWTKVWAEEAVRAAAGNAVIARVAIVMGLPVIGAGNSFLARMMAAWREGRAVGVPDMEIRTPVDVITLGRALLELARNDFRGLIHLSGNDVLNRCEMARRIAVRLGHAPELVYANNPETIPGRAPRPRDVSLSNALARSTLKTPMLGLEDGLDLIMEIAKGQTP
jgi:dTDP-4-dehydrorhamnose reductase